MSYLEELLPEFKKGAKIRKGNRFGLYIITRVSIIITLSRTAAVSVLGFF